MTEKKKVVLAFSGGLDTSFCVPWLMERGYDVYTLFADTGGVSEEERRYIEERAKELGAVEHRTVDVAGKIWDDIVVPLVRGGTWYQGQYPLLCSDRYIIVEESLRWCDQLGTKAFAHGCTAMGNDQVRFDLTVRGLGDYEIIAPIRELQRETREVREYEQWYLQEKGFSVRAKAKSYTINENLLGVTISGGEIDRWEFPGEGARLWSAPPPWPAEPLTLEIEFVQGCAVALDGERMSGPEILKTLNQRCSRYGIGRGMYTGDTTIGLKGRIVFEAPGITALTIAHRAVEEAVLTKHQNRFKGVCAERWVELVYEGFYFEPLKQDLDAFITSTQRAVSGTVQLHSAGAVVTPVAIRSPNILRSPKATYAQGADWSVAEAEGFIRLFGQSSTLWREVRRGRECE